VLQLLSDNATRWNSFYRAITRALNVKERIQKFLKQHTPSNRSEYDPNSDRLTPKDWTYLEKIHTCLETFYAATMTLLSEWFPTLHHLLNETDAWKQEAEEYLQDEYLVASLTAAWHKIEKYYAKVDEMPVYYAAVMLNPTLKAHYFKHIWQNGTTTQQAWIEHRDSPSLPPVDAVLYISRGTTLRLHVKRLFHLMSDSATKRHGYRSARLRRRCCFARRTLTFSRV